MKRFVIVGLGTFGGGVAEALYGRGHDVIGLDPDERAVDALAPYCSRAAVADGRQAEALREAGAEAADAAVVSTGDDLTASILSVLALQDLGVETIYAKVTSRDHARVMKRLGVTETIFPERESARNLATRVSDESVLDSVRLARDLSVQELVVPEAWRGRTLRDLEVRARHGVSVVGVHDTESDAMVVPPDPDAPLEATDTLLLAGPDDALDAVAERAGESAGPE